MRMKLAATAAIALAAMPLSASADGEVNIYSYRQAYLLEPLLNAFTEETGIEANGLMCRDPLASKRRATAQRASLSARRIRSVDMDTVK